MGSVEWLAVLDYGTFRVHEDGRVIGIPGYAIKARNARVVLVDGGFPSWYYEDSRAAGLRDGLDTFGEITRLVAENRPKAQLALLGISSEEVTDLVLTHGDVDHVGALDLFPGATLLVGRTEWELDHPRYFGEARSVAWPRNRAVSLVDGDEELLPGLTLLASPGHSPGHLSLLVRLRRTGAVLLTADAIARPAEVETGRFGGAWNEELAASSAARLLDVAARENAMVIFGHDPDQWRSLRKAPERYF